VESVKREFEGTHLTVQYASNRSTGDEMDCEEVLVLLLVLSVAGVLRAQGGKKTMKEKEIEHVGKFCYSGKWHTGQKTHIRRSTILKLRSKILADKQRLRVLICFIQSSSKFSFCLKTTSLL
jgi:hypothetical protein